MADAPGLPCPACGFSGPSLDPGTCGRCGVVFARLHAAEVGGLPQVSLGVPVPPPKASSGLLVASEPPTENLWALPTAFGFALLVNLSPFGKVVIFSSAGNWAHELGHATWRWLNGRDAIPLLFITLYFDTSRSVVTSLFVLGGLAALFLWARTEACRGLQTLAVAFFVLFLGCAMFVRPDTEHFLESFAGIFGQFWIGTLWVILFYYRFPLIVQWERLRYAFLFLGALSVTYITGVFLRSRHDMSLLPWGAFFGGDGDLDKLLDGGWLVPTIRRVYFTTAGVCLAVIVAHYLYFLRSLSTKRR